MLGLEFSLSTSSVEKLAKIMGKHKVHMFSTSVGILSIWSEKGHQRPDRNYDMRDILASKNVQVALAHNCLHQLEDFVASMLERADELDNKRSST